jgi:RHS repeat-associated protein
MGTNFREGFPMLRQWERAKLMVVLGVVSNLLSFAFGQHAFSPFTFPQIVSSLVAEGKLKEAENLLQKLSQNSDPIVSFKAKRILAEMLRQRGDFEKAKGLLTSLLSFPAKEPSLRAEQARASLNLAWCFLTQPNPDFQKALSIFEQTASSFSDVKERDEDGSSPSCKAAFNVGLLLLRMGRKEEGISALRSFILRHKDCCYLAMRAREKLEDLGVLPRIGFLPFPIKTNGLLHRKTDCGPKALAFALKEMGILNGRSVREVAKEIVKMVKVDRYGTTFSELAKAAGFFKVSAEGFYGNNDALISLPKPSIAWVNRSHFVTVLSVKGLGRWKRVEFYDPSTDKIHNLSLSDFSRLWDGYLLVLRREGKKLVEGKGLLLGMTLPLAFFPLISLTLLLPSSLSLRVRKRRKRARSFVSGVTMICFFSLLLPPSPVKAEVKGNERNYRYLTRIEMERIKGADAGGAEPWRASYPLLSCPSCGQGGVSGGSVNALGITDEGNLLLDNAFLNAGGVLMPLTLKVYLSSQDTAPYFYGAFQRSLKTNYHQKIIGAASAYNTQGGTTTAEWTSEDGKRVVFTKAADGSWVPQAGHHEKLQPIIESARGFPPYPIFKGWLLTKEDGTKLRFEYVGGGSGNYQNRLVYIEDQNGNKITISYDPNDVWKILSVTDPNGRSLTFSYPSSNVVQISDWSGRAVTLDSSTNPLTITDGAGNQVKIYTRLIFYTDPYGNPVYPKAVVVDKVVDALGRTTVFNYDETQNKPPVIGKVNPDNSSVSLVYTADSSGNLVRVIVNEGGNKVRHIYDSQKRLIKVEVESPKGSGNFVTVEERSYDADNNIISRKDGNGNTWSMSYDSRGNLLSVTNPDGTQVFYTYDANNKVTSFTDETGKQWLWQYDSRGNLISEQDPVQAALGVAVTYQYDSKGRRVSTTDAFGKTTQYVYDSNDNLIKVIDPLGNTVQFGYDSLGRRTSVTDPLGNTTYFSYDANDRIIQVTYPDGTTRSFTYDCCNKTSETDENGRTTYYEYDNMGRLVRVYLSDDPLKQHPIEQVYTPEGKLVGVKDRNGNWTKFSYDAFGRLVKMERTDSSGNVLWSEEYGYDGAGNIVWKKKGDGTIINYQYDSRGRLVLIDYPKGIDTQFVYDAAGRKIQVIDKTGQYDYAYNDRGDLVSVTYPAVGTNPRRVVSYQYDAMGRVVKRSFTGYGDTTYLYDDAGRMVSLTTPDGKTFSFAYNDASALVQESYPNGTVAVYSYNPKGFLVSLQNKKSDGSVISGFSYVLDSSGNRLKVTEVPSGETVEYGYDGIYQLIRETRKDSAGNVILDIGYEYDLNGNRVRMVDYKNGGEVVYSYNALDQMLSAGNISFGYDGNGNVIRKVVSGQETQYLWDYEDKMVKIVYPNGSVNEFETNYEGKRRKKVDSSGVTYFFYDGDKLLAEVDGSDNLMAVYEWGVRGLLSQWRNGARYYYHFDGLGSVMQVTDGSQNVVASYKYDAWGNDLVDPQFPLPNPFKYVGMLGYYSDKESGLKLLGVRYYDSQIGRFWSLDPIVKLNRYLYAQNNPARYVDPLGLDDIDWECFSLCMIPCLIKMRKEKENGGRKYTEWEVFALCFVPCWQACRKKRKPIFPIIGPLPTPGGDRFVGIGIGITF